MAFVYLLCDSGQDNCFKIGVAKKSIEKRKKQLQTGNCSEIFLSDYHETDYPYYIEKMLHQKHYPEKKIGEWFELTTESVINFKKECEELEKLIENMKDNPFFIKYLK